MTACHHLRGGIFGTPFGGPRMSPTPRSAKYGATHSANRLPGLEITSPLVIICRRRSGSDGIPSLVQRIYLIYCKKCALLHVTNMRSIRISATAETMTGGVHFRHPGGGGSRA